MNRRAFLGAAGLAPVAAVVAVAGPAYASDVTGEARPEAIVPLKRLRVVNVVEPSVMGEYLKTEDVERIVRRIAKRMM